MTSTHFTVCRFLLGFRCEWSIGSMWVKELTKPIGPRSLNSGSQLWLFIYCKSKLKKNIYFFEKIYLVFTKYELFAEKMFLYEKKVLY